MTTRMKTGCIIVLYNPNLSILSLLLSAIYKQVDYIFISDNSKEKTYSDFEKYPNINYHFNEGNKGIAFAQNIGIKYLKELNVDFILFLDQDSIPPDNLISKLYIRYTELTVNGYQVGGVGPRPFNRAENKKYKGMIKKGNRISPVITEVGQLISSASFIPINNFEKVGYMDDSLFIDGVDHEWCWRAKKRNGLRFFIIEDVFLSHQLGEGDRFFLVKKVAIPTPFRTYYQFRNYLRLIRKDYVPMYWKITNGLKYIIKYFYFSIFVFPQHEYFSRINKGIKDGFLNH